jgi:hypothetical protein
VRNRCALSIKVHQYSGLTPHCGSTQMPSLLPQLEAGNRHIYQYFDRIIFYLHPAEHYPYRACCLTVSIGGVKTPGSSQLDLTILVMILDPLQ